MNRLVFVTTELHPETPGGAGVLIDQLARTAARIRPVVIVLLTMGEVEIAARPGVEVATHPSAEGFLERSQAAASALRTVAEPGDRIEFHDFEGLGFWTLAHRHELGLTANAVTVRFHGPYDLISKTLDVVPLEWSVPRVMEAESFRMADRVIVPVEGHRETLEELYGVETDRIVLGPPPIDSFGSVDPSTDSNSFAVLGRLGEVKGSDLMVSAALTLLEEGYRLAVRFIGADGWSAAANQPMSQVLEELIPESRRGSFEFVPRVQREELPSALSGVRALIVPSRFESFCLAAHEARRAGLPVIAPAIPAFTGLFGRETGALLYPPVPGGLVEAMRQLLDDPGLTSLLATSPPPVVGEPIGPYSTDPEPRLERSQAGLATAATQKLETVLRELTPKRRSAQGLFRYVPGSVAKVAIKILPRGLKDRFRDVASWPAEQARRERAARLTAVRRQIEEGRFPPVVDPDVTVVIPVHDQVDFLEETLASVYEQTHDSWEIVVVDDGSSDPVSTEALAQLDRPRLTMIRQENRGLPAARNAGIRRAKGRYVIPLDADDEIDATYMKRMLFELEAHPEAAFAHCYARLYHDVNALWMTRPFNPYWQLLGNGVVGCVLLRRRAWEQVGGYDESMTEGNEDWELWVRLIASGWEQVQVPEVLFRYRKHGISMSVETEARFERGRRQMRDRHPRLYEAESLEAAKRRYYPLVTAVHGGEAELHPDIEVVGSIEELRSTWGKYVVDIRGVSAPPADVILRLAGTLEENPKAKEAVTTAEVPLRMVRRWNLHDPIADPSGTILLEDPTPGAELELPELVERELWSPPSALLSSDLPLQRMPPEEEGYLPAPETW